MDGRFTDYSSGPDGFTGAVDDTFVVVSVPETPEWINPVVGPVTSLFGQRVNPVTQAAEFHNGIDIAVPIGTPVLAVRHATVFHVGDNHLNGKYLRLRCDAGYEIVFAHLNEILVSLDERVEQGQKIAYSGNTGQSTGPHLHYGLFRNGQMVDPLSHVELTLSYNAALEYAARNP